MYVLNLLEGLFGLLKMVSLKPNGDSRAAAARSNSIGRPSDGGLSSMVHHRPEDGTNAHPLEVSGAPTNDKQRLWLY